jgi:predicted Zn-dependent peptidase
LNLLQTILYNGESSRMYSRLVDKDQIALDVSPSLSPAFDPTFVVITAQPKEGIAPEKCEAAIYEELELVKKTLVSDRELEKARNIRLAEFYRQMRTISGRADTIGTYDVFGGDYRKLFDVVKNYNTVTKEDLQRVAKKYFGVNNRTVATLVPENPEPPAAQQPTTQEQAKP